ncbi:MAG: phBC6A51 family helix-turn-helix protein [Lentisphaeria bacterium]
MATKKDELTLEGLNHKQHQAAILLADPAYTGNITELCEEIDVARSTFYRWMATSEFKRHVEKMIDIYTDAELSRAWKALMQLIDCGDIQAIKLFFELKGKYRTGATVTESDKLDSLISAINEVD